MGCGMADVTRAVQGGVPVEGLVQWHDRATSRAGIRSLFRGRLAPKQSR